MSDRDCKHCKHLKPDGCSRWECEYVPVMSDLISREDAIEAIASRDETDGTVKAFTGREVNEILSALPSAVEVVRCKDCKHAHMTYGGECKYCDKWEEDGEALYLDGDFFCAYGEKREL